MITLSYRSFKEHDRLLPLHYYVMPFKLKKNNELCDGLLYPEIILKIKKENTHKVLAHCIKCHGTVQYYVNIG